MRDISTDQTTRDKGREQDRLRVLQEMFLGQGSIRFGPEDRAGANGAYLGRLIEHLLLEPGWAELLATPGQDDPPRGDGKPPPSG